MMMKKVLFYAGCWLTALALCCACSSDDDEGQAVIDPVSTTTVYIAVGEEDGSDADVSFVNGTRCDMLIVDLDDVGLCKQMDFISEAEQDMCSMTFGSDGLPANLATETGVISFANYDGTKVDIAIIEGEDIEIYKEVECPYDWDVLKNSLRVAAESSRLNAPARGSIVDAALAADKWLRENNEAITLTFDAIDNAMLGAGVVKSKTVTEKNLIEGFENWVVPGVENALGNSEGGKGMGTVLGTVTTIKDLVVSVAQKSTYGLLKWVLTNYPAIENKMEDGFYLLFTVLDDNNDNMALGQGALNSGYGTLKVTMAWNFYADVDVHAIEPSGTHIYYGDKVSHVTGGFLDVDDRHGGEGAVENIYWETPEDGVYTVYINWYSASTWNGESGTGTVKLTIMRKGRGQVFEIPLGIYETKDVAEVTMPDGTVVDRRSRSHIKLSIPVKEKE